MHCVDSRDGMSTSFLVCPSIIQCAEPNLGQDGRKALALALARALAESTRMQPLNDILRARQPSEPKCRATESVSRDPEARPKTSTSHTTDRILKLHKCQDARRANHGGLTQFARFSRRGLWSQCRSLLLRTVLAVSQCECDFGRRRWRACSPPFTDRIGNGFHSTRYMCSGFYGPRLSSRRKPVDDTTRLIRGREGEREERKNKLLPLVSLSRTMTVAGIECPRT